MVGDKVFQIAILVSVIAHGALLLQNPNLNVSPARNREQKIELSYLKPPKEEPKVSPKPAPVKKESFLKLSSRFSAPRTPPPFIHKQEFYKSKESLRQESSFAKPAFTKPDVSITKKRISLPPVDLDKINNPSYISYYQIVREKIRRAAYQNYNRAEEVGEIYLSFIISSDGILKEVILVKEKSSISSYLSDIALRSIKDASPFPNFPQELDYAQLSFNVVISFELE